MLTSPATCLILGWWLFFVYAYPGYLSPDSVVQLTQGRAGTYSNWHPPVMAAMWGVLDRIISGPFLMLVAQSGAFLFGLYAILKHAMSARTAAIMASLILLFPPVLTSMAVIWKDSQMAGYLLAGVACMLAKRRPVRVVGCLFFVVATAVRITAPAATLPLVFGLFVWRDGWVWWKRYPLAVVVWLAITLTAFRANTALTDKQEHTWHTAVAIHDIAGTLYRSRAHSDAELQEILRGTHLRVTTNIQQAMRRNYTSYNFWTLNHGDDPVFAEVPTEAQLEPVARAWQTIVTSNPLAYFYHRLRVSKALLGLDRRVLGWGSVWDGFENGVARWDSIEFQSTHSAWQKLWVDSLMSIATSRLFRPYVYLLLALLLLPLARHRLAFWLLAGGLGCEASFFAGAASPDFRYSHWMIVSTITAGVILFAHRYRAGRACPPAG